MVLGFITALVFGGAILVAIVTALTRRPAWARLARWLGLASLGLGLVGLFLGVGITTTAMSESGHSQADRQRMLSNLVAESVYALLVTTGVAAPALAIGWWVLRKRRTSNSES
jgi:hypothetical protein